MKTKTSNPKIEFLLGAGLDVLHQESQEWLDTIAFWKDETRFFATLLQKSETKGEKNSELGKMLNNLEKIHADLFDYLADDIMRHERLLARLQQAEKGLADIDYRNQHRKLQNKMVFFESDFRDFKNLVFGTTKNL
jgi:hypothetical protein